MADQDMKPIICESSVIAALDSFIHSHCNIHKNLSAPHL